MQMPGKCESRVDKAWVMAKSEVLNAPRIAFGADTQRRRRGAGVAIVVSFDQHQIDGRVALAPRVQRRQCLRRVCLSRMKKIAQKNDGAWLQPIDEPA